LVEEFGSGGDKLLPIGKAAELLGVSVGTLRAWADKGLVHTIRLPSGYRRFTKEEIDEMRRQMGYED
jgi:excisionase family DNA binding protein